MVEAIMIERTSRFSDIRVMIVKRGEGSIS